LGAQWGGRAVGQIKLGDIWSDADPETGDEVVFALKK
jgi:hypothetical protein